MKKNQLAARRARKANRRKATLKGRVLCHRTNAQCWLLKSLGMHPGRPGSPGKPGKQTGGKGKKGSSK